MTWEELRRHHLLVYTTTWCPDCHRLKRLLRLKEVPFTEVDIESEPAAAARLQAQTGRCAIPFVQVDGGPLIRGWHEGAPGRLSEAQFLAETAAALTGVGNA